MSISLSVLFWCYAIAYSIHIVEEAILGGGFVKMVQKNIWASYSEKRFFWFNTFLYLTNVFGIIIFDIYGGAWLLFPLSFAWMFVTNGVWHLIGSLVTGKYSPGLVTSPLYWIIMLFIFKYNALNHVISIKMFYVSFFTGAILTVSMVGSLFLGSKYINGN